MMADRTGGERGRTVHPLIRERWSPREFARTPVEPEAVRSLLEAARWAPSSYNEQPWAFLVAMRADEEEHRRMLECLVPGNRRWARDAPVLMVAAAKRRFDRNDRENAHARHDVGLAVGNLLLQATALGLSAHPMAGFDARKVRERYGVPDGWDPVTALAVGYAVRGAEPDERSRKPLREFVFGGRWSRPADVLGPGEPEADGAD